MLTQIERDTAILEGYRQGVRIVVMARMFGVTGERVRQVLARDGLVTRGNRGQPERNREIVRRRLAGETLASIGRAYGVTPGRIKYIVDRLTHTGLRVAA